MVGKDEGKMISAIVVFIIGLITKDNLGIGEVRWLHLIMLFGVFQDIMLLALGMKYLFFKR